MNRPQWFTLIRSNRKYCCNTCSDCVCILGTLRLHVCSFLDLETPGESLLGLPERLQHKGLLVVTDNPTALCLPFMVQSSSANHITEHIRTGVLLFQAVPVRQENSSVDLPCWTNNESTMEETNYLCTSSLGFEVPMN